MEFLLNKEKFIEVLEEAEGEEKLSAVRKSISDLKSMVFLEDLSEEIFTAVPEEETVSFRRDILVSELDQIIEARTKERASYYLKRLIKSIQKVKTGKINDINLLRWKEYDHILTDSLWLLGKRDSSGEHLSWYWGNFVPQIPRQMMIRYTRKGDWVLDAFSGSGTTLIECRRLGRNGIGIELNPGVAKKSLELILKEENKENIVSELITGDSREADVGKVLRKHGREKAELLFMHPPYQDIIKFSEDKRDLSNACGTDDFLRQFGLVVDNLTPFLKKERYAVLVIGDKYSRGEWIPLGFYCMNEVLKRGYILKSIIVKNFDETKGKRKQKELWRYRALAGGFYVFKHEYIMLFKKL